MLKGFNRYWKKFSNEK